MFDYEAEAHLQLCQVAMMEVFANKLTICNSWTISAKCSVVDVCHGFIYTTDGVFQGAIPYK